MSASAWSWLGFALGTVVGVLVAVFASPIGGLAAGGGLALLLVRDDI